jgi:hypothetical protein
MVGHSALTNLLWFQRILPSCFFEEELQNILKCEAEMELALEISMTVKNRSLE